MIKFNPDYAILGTIAADLTDVSDVKNAVVTYCNGFLNDHFGYRCNEPMINIMAEILQDKERAESFLNKLVKEKKISFEGKLNGYFVKYHSVLVDETERGGQKFIQAAIMDISESIILKNMLYDTSEALKRAAEAADEDTGFHVVRINKYSNKLARLKGMPDKFCSDIAQFAQLHDIGKIKVSELIRLPRKLTDDEFNEIKQHASYGGEMVKGLEGLEMAYNIAIDHHEKFDGTGYPNGKKGKEISIEGRIVAIADVFDALVSKRAYKEAFSYEKTFDIFKNGDGRVEPSHFDSELLKLFLDNYKDFVQLHKQLK